MAHAENTVIIKRPISDVYAFIANPLNELKWRNGIQSIALKSGIAGTVGASGAAQAPQDRRGLALEIELRCGLRKPKPCSSRARPGRIETPGSTMYMVNP
ncbi:hypothetical protein OOZ51_08500 [Arthrobacter sp. MI7-26]|uniref:hypothetical protein n=1 Tax=Arthrobacter sp. MI7-26 TaxID=2993653 RepID=UPI0022498D98|nr:hypothetical protein [Arthrobacter sp. MI7-26]MCX2747859.1 hypothetical protein [Arthrobacter sp. MI7-26]